MQALTNVPLVRVSSMNHAWTGLMDTIVFATQAFLDQTASKVLT